MTPRRLMVGIAATSLAAVLFGSGVAAATSPVVAGAGLVTLPAWFGDTAGDPVVFGLQARCTGAQATGTFTVVHVDDAGAVATGIVREPSFRDVPWDIRGTAFAVTVDDLSTGDRLGFDFEFFDASTIPPCAEVDPVVAVQAGNFSVR